MGCDGDSIRNKLLGSAIRNHVSYFVHATGVTYSQELIEEEERLEQRVNKVEPVRFAHGKHHLV